MLILSCNNCTPPNNNRTTKQILNTIEQTNDRTIKKTVDNYIYMMLVDIGMSAAVNPVLIPVVVMTSSRTSA